jgi:serine protease Do
MNRKASFAALLAVVAVSIIFGMVLGGRLNAPPIVHAARETVAGSAFPAATDSGTPTIALPDFSDIAEAATPAVVGVQNTSYQSSGDEDSSEDEESSPESEDPFYRFFFGPPGERDRSQGLPRSSPRRVSAGSGFIITEDGYILTNNHVVQGAKKLQVTLDSGEKFEATVVGTDPMIDLGLIKIDPKGKKLSTLPLGDSDTLKIGHWVMAIGNPLGLERTVTVGIVSGKKRQVPIGDTVPGLANFIQTDAAINFGNSGGPLLDGRGRVVGISTAIFRGELAEGIGFAIPINEARRAAEELRAGGSVKRGYLGIEMNTTGITDKARTYFKLPDTNGVLISKVTANGPGEKAGLQKDDIVRKIDGEVIKNNQDLVGRVAAHRPGETVRLDVLRDGEPVKVDVTLGNRPVSFDEEGRERPADPHDDESAGASGKGFGIKVQSIPSFLRRQYEMEDDESGVVIVAVDPDSDAAEEGLTPRTVIVGINGHRVSGLSDWNRLVRDLQAGSTAKLEIRMRPGRTESVFVTVPRTSSK